MEHEDALRFGRKHVETWNSHDLDAICSLYTDSVELISPLASALVGSPSVVGKQALRAYFAAGLQRYPELRFELMDVFACVRSVTLLFRGAGGKLVAEVLFVDAELKIERVLAHYRCEAPAA